MGSTSGSGSGPRLLLASQSPRRQTLLGLLGLAYRAQPADVPEDEHLLAEPLVAALNVALAKARAATAGSADDLVVAADTLVVCDGRILGKPVDAREARAMLRLLRGRSHAVLTGVAVKDASGREWGGVVSSQVEMRAFSDEEIERYIARGEPFDKAGGYAVQDRAFGAVHAVHGCYLNVVGLPLCAVSCGLESFGLAVERPRTLRPPCAYCERGAQHVAIGDPQA